MIIDGWQIDESERLDMSDRGATFTVADLISFVQRQKNYSKREELAIYTHSAWANWMAHLFEKSTTNLDGSVTIPAPLVERWRRQVGSSYAFLPDSEKLSDLKEADDILEIINGD